MARNDPQVNFRIPQELKDKLEEAAKNNCRSITSELVLRLEQSFEETELKPQTQIINAGEALQTILKEIQSLKSSKSD